MQKRSTTNAFYKYEDFLTGPGFKATADIHGLSVRFNQPFYEHDLFKYNFRSDFLTVLLIVKGELTFSLNLENFTAEDHSLVIIAPNSIRKVGNVSIGTIVSGVNFTMDFLTAIGMHTNSIELLDYFSSQFSPHWLLEQKDASAIQKLIRQLNKKIELSECHLYGKELVYHTFYIFLYEVYGLTKKYAVPLHHHVTRKENLVKNFIHIVQKDFKTQRSVINYAAVLHISPKYLTETVKEITGKTAGEVIDDYVILEARSLLDNPDLSVAEIADALHFSDQSFFGKYFKRHTGLSPKAYRLKD